jgi:hypothetical protein
MLYWLLAIDSADEDCVAEPPLPHQIEKGLVFQALFASRSKRANA